MFGWLNNPPSSLQALSQTAAALGVKVSAHGVNQRFSSQVALGELIGSGPAALPLLERFKAIIVQASTI